MALSTSGADAQLTPVTGKGAALQRTLDSLRVALRAPGIQATIRKDGSLVWSGVSGTSAPGVPMTHDRLIRIGSVTKPFTAAVALQLMAEGRLHLDDTVSLWFPRFRNGGRITIAQLLSHRAGVPEVLTRKSYLIRGTMSPGHQFQLGEMLDWLSTRDQDFAPGARFQYSNGNYILLGAILERVTDSSAAQLIRARVLAPLALEHTVFLPDEASRVRGAVASGVDRDHIPLPGDTKVGPDDRSWASLAYTSGAMAATASDVAVFMEALNAGRVVPDSLLRRATTFGDAADDQVHELRGYGLGLELLVIDGERWVGHLGDFVGSGSAAATCRENGYTIAVSGTMSRFDGVAAIRALRRTVRQ